DRVGETGSKVLAIEVDIRSPASVEAMMVGVYDAFGRIDILVNNAGIWKRPTLDGLLNCPEEAWDAFWEVNVKGSWLCYKAAVPYMKTSGGGRIINISSMSST